MRPGRRSWIRQIAVVSLLVGACGNATLTAAPTAGPSSTVVASSGSGPSPGTDASLDPAFLAGVAITLEGIGKTEGDLLAGARLRAGTTRLLRSSSAAIFAAVDKASLSVAQQLTAGTGAGVHDGLASIATPEIPPTRRLDGTGVPVGGVIALTIGDVTSAMQRNETSRDTSGVKAKDDSVVDGSKVHIDISGTTRLTSSGSRLTGIADIDLSVTVTAPDGQVVTFKERAEGETEVDFCPDRDGVANGLIQLTLTESAAAGGSTNGGTTSILGQFKAIVNDQAAIARTDVETQVNDSYTNDGQQSTVSAQVGWSEGPGGKIDESTFHAKETKTGDVTADQARAAAKLGMLAAEFASGLVGDEAAKKWQNGACVEIVVTEGQSGEVAPDAKVTITAKPHHKIEGVDLDKPITGTLADKASLDPAGVALDPPGTWTYTAGHDEGDQGTVKLRSVSNRGIGETSLKFTVRNEVWLLDIKGEDVEELTFGPINFKVDLKVDATKVEVRANSDGSIGGSGPVTISGPIKATIEQLGGCTGSYTQHETVVVKGTKQGEGADAVLVVTLEIQAQSVAGTLRCKIQGQSLTAPHGFGGRWAQTIGEVRLPTVGVTVKVDRTGGLGGVPLHATATFTLTPKRD